MDHVIKWITVTTLLFAESYVDGFCHLNNLGKNPCEGEVFCKNDFQNLGSSINDWSCRRHEDYDYHYSYRRRVRVDENYSLYVKVENVDVFDDGSHVSDPFNDINNIVDHILTISVNSGNMTSVPRTIYYLRKATAVDLSRNTLESFDLGMFSKLVSLCTLNVSYNQIVDLEVGEKPTGGGFNGLNTLDMSHNGIKAIPNNYFRQFSELLHLNLSHNYINNIDILTFEGITQLQSLYISDNEITTIGLNFARFVDLRELFLDHNYLTSVEENNFKTMTKLEKLNLSSNSIARIDNNALDNLIEIKVLDLSNNKINTITKTIFQHNNNLISLDITTNNISKIEPGAFEGKRIEEFVIHNNPISGSLVKNTFEGIIVEKLDLSGSNINELGADLFDGQFKILNFSRNSISNIHNTTFSKLVTLSDLDLSYNQLESIDFDMSKTNISYLYLNNNHIKKITNVLFKSLASLKVINLSNNALEEIDLLSFQDLHELESLILNNNPLLRVVPSNLFSGVASATDLDLSNSKIYTIQNNAFIGMEELKIFNASYSNVHVLQDNVFNGTGSIEIIDLSYNHIEIFSLNNANMRILKRIYLQYNNIHRVSDKTFKGLTDLSVVNLEGNDIIRIENNAFDGFKILLKLYLSGNKDMVFNSSTFSNLPSLSVVLLDNVTSGFNFQNIENTSITGLDLSFCDITDINSVYLYQIKTLERLKLVYNIIRSIDKISFQKLRNLYWLDLSYNRLSNIQPGSFSDNEDLSHLNLSNNYLSSLQFGVFDGLLNLNTLDLSTNTLHSFSVSVFHNVPRVKTLYLDDNLIEDLKFSEFSEANITNIYIGGNPLPCDRLTMFKKNINLRQFISVRAKKVVFDKENVDGISCKSKTRIDELIIDNGNQTALTASLTSLTLTALENFRITIERFLNRNESQIDLESIGFKNVSTSIERFLKDFNKSETNNNMYLEKLINLNNNTNRVLGNIQEYIKIRDSVSIDPNTHQTGESAVRYDEIEKTMLDMLAKEKASMKNEFKGMFDDWKVQNVKENHFEAQSVDREGSTDLKTALYFIGTCLVVLLGVLVMAIILAYYKFRNNIPYSNSLSQSRQPISNSIEME